MHTKKFLDTNIVLDMMDNIRANHTKSLKILVVIPILDPPELFFANVVEKLVNQSMKAEILLINSGAKIIDGEYEVIDIDQKEFNHANTRNIALSYEVDYYLFMTQDAAPHDAYLGAKLLKVFDDPEVVVAYARQLPYPDADPIERFARETNYPPQSRVKSINDLPLLGIKTFFSSDSCAMYRGSYFREIGGFTQDLNTNEDMEYAARAVIAGKKVAYCAHAKVVHSHRFTLRQVWSRYFEIGSFFARHKWILDTVSQYHKAESTGIGQAVSELKHLAIRSPLWLFRSSIISVMKFVAFKYAIIKYQRDKK